MTGINTVRCQSCGDIVESTRFVELIVDGLIEVKSWMCAGCILEIKSIFVPGDWMTPKEIREWIDTIEYTLDVGEECHHTVDCSTCKNAKMALQEISEILDLYKETSLLGDWMKFYILCSECQALYATRSKTAMSSWIQTHLSNRLCANHCIRVVRVIDWNRCEATLRAKGSNVKTVDMKL